MINEIGLNTNLINSRYIIIIIFSEKSFNHIIKYNKNILYAGKVKIRFY